MKYDHLFGPYGPNFKGTRSEFDRRCAVKEMDLGRELTKAEVIVQSQWTPGEPLHSTGQGLSNIDYNKETEKAMREFETGATRDDDTTKPDYEGYLSPLVIRRFGEYMTKHRKQADGKMRDSDNWQKGIPIAAYMKSLWRHLVDLWSVHRKYLSIWPSNEGHHDKEEALCAIIFNASGYLHEILKPELSVIVPPPAADQEDF